jgi:hypothetical protein
MLLTSCKIKFRKYQNLALEFKDEIKNSNSYQKIINNNKDTHKTKQILWQPTNKAKPVNNEDSERYGQKSQGYFYEDHSQEGKISHSDQEYYQNHFSGKLEFLEDRNESSSLNTRGQEDYRRSNDYRSSDEYRQVGNSRVNVDQRRDQSESRRGSSD